MKLKKICSVLMCSIIIFSSSINVFAYSSSNDNSSKVYSDNLSDSFTENLDIDGQTVEFKHSTDENGNKTIEVIENDRRDIVKYNKSADSIYLNGKKVVSITKKTSNVTGKPSDSPIIKALSTSYSNNWYLNSTEEARWLVANFTKASLAAVIAVFAVKPVAVVAVLVAGCYYTSAWMSSRKNIYYCTDYNGTWKAGVKYESDIYADRNFSDYLTTYTTETSR